MIVADTALSLVILSWNTRDVTLACLESILANPPDVPWELIVIDNASSDDSANAIDVRTKDIPNVKFIRNENNTGFTGGNNQGMRMARGQVVGLLNSDTIVPGQALSRLFHFVEDNPDIGVVGPCLTHEDGSPTTSFGYFPTAWRIFTTAFLPGWMWGNERKALGVVPDGSMSGPMDVDYVSGAAFFVRRDVIDKVGMFDEETFFAYFEETDWCMRIRKAGWRIVFLPDIKITHLEGRSFEKMTGHRRILQYDSAKKFFKKHYSFPIVLWYQFCTVLGSLVKVCYFGIRMLLQPSQKDRWIPHYRWNAFVFDLWRRGFGLERGGVG